MKIARILLWFIALLILPVYATQYYCPSSSNSGYSPADIYDTTAGCDKWNSDFWKKNHPNAYNFCLQEQQKLKNRYRQGKCTLIKEKTFIIDGCNCSITMSPKYNIIHSYNCYGGASCRSNSEALEKLKNMYK